MAQGIKTLAKDTAVYGISSMVGRFLNWCLVPLYTHVFDAGEYGIVTLVYSVVALLMVVLTYGMETGFFRFANHERWSNPIQVYTTAMSAISLSSVLFVGIVFIGLSNWAHWLDCSNHPSYVWIMGITVAIDAFTSLPFAYLRYQRRSVRFAGLKIISIVLNILFNIFFIIILPSIAEWPVFRLLWNEDFGVGYIFLSNLLSSFITLILLFPELKVKWSFSRRLLREMFAYSFPLLVLGLAGIMNQTLDKILYPMLITDKGEAMSGLGIYGANYKIAIIMVMFIQAFRFAYEPFIFARNKQKGDNKEAYSDAMKWFVISSMFIFVSVMMLLDVVKWFIAPEYFSGLSVVPIIMLAELFFGIFFNLSVWYKVSDRTYWGSLFSIIGLSVTIGANAWLVPIYGYMGCAWAALCCYGVMMLLSWIVGRILHPIDYDMKSVVFYCFAGIGLWWLVDFITAQMNDNVALCWCIKISAILFYLLFVMIKENLGSALLRKARNGLHHHSR